ncbi:hypothetical protein HY493_04900 [Candidatus Woesearchaeota archaeon]|nr:hypothetical protein [Candidatus Woesearchaeota archaeon]
MTEFGNSFKSIRFTLVPNASIAASGNAVTSFSAESVTGRIIGMEVGSPAFSASTGSLYVIASGSTWNQNRQVTLIKGIGQSRAFYDTSVFRQVEGASVSGTATSALIHPFVDGDAIRLTSSGTFGGTGNIVLFYQ